MITYSIVGEVDFIRALPSSCGLHLLLWNGLCLSLSSECRTADRAKQGGDGREAFVPLLFSFLFVEQSVDDMLEVKCK